MKTINIEIQGITPILFNRYDVEGELSRQKGKRINKTYHSKEEAEKSVYWGTGKKKELVLPSLMLYACMLNASSFHKIGKRSAKSILAGSIKIEPSEISFGTDKYDIDIRPVVIQRARVLKSRATLKEWKLAFQIVYSEQLIGDSQIIKTILEEAGQRIGLADFSPRHSGYFGTFKITKFEEK